MILHFDQLPLFFGVELARHRGHFESQGRATFALLMCRWAMEDRLASSGGEHAEARLLRSSVWTDEIPAAVAQAGDSPPGMLDDPDAARVTVVLAVNRSPCRDCTGQLVQALGGIHRQYPWRSQSVRFILACRGVYEGDSMRAATTQCGLEALADAGWELATLVTEATPSPSGRVLLRGITPLMGHGHVRLDR